jgi:diguanylate cyclase (GGDEF)-like protein
MITQIATFLTWSLSFPLVALVSGLAVLKGIDHPWVETCFVISTVAAFFSSIYVLGTCLTLFKKLSRREDEYARIQDSYNMAEKTRVKLQEEVERLSEMRAINMSSQIESFAELLKSALTITHFTTGAKTLSIYLESVQQVGSIYPKAHIRWESEAAELPGCYYAYFDSEIILNNLEDDHIHQFKFRVDAPSEEDEHQGALRGDLNQMGRQVGRFDAPPYEGSAETALTQVEKYVQNLDILTNGALNCWQSRGGNHLNIGSHTFLNVPIFSQGTIIGVLQAEMGEAAQERTMSEISKLQYNLRDIARSIGQPLRKEQLYEQATKDALTGLYNKALYGQQLHDHFHRCLRYQRKLAYIFLDIDHFKNINDTYGHLTGDIALKSVSRILLDNIRQSDTAYRFGGEELCVLLPESSEEDGVEVAEKLRAIIESTEFPTDQDITIRFTASFGVACTTDNMRRPEDLSSCADEAVYHAKRNGRNKVVAYSSLPKMPKPELPSSS